MNIKIINGSRSHGFNICYMLYTFYNKEIPLVFEIYILRNIHVKNIMILLHLNNLDELKYTVYYHRVLVHCFVYLFTILLMDTCWFIKQTEKCIYMMY